MKKILSIVSLLITFYTYSQVPQGISYQAIALNSSGNPVVSANVGLRLSILDNAATGTVLYTESHTKMTNAQGLFNLVVGQGTTTVGTFSTINWGTNSKFLKVELDIAGGTSYVLVGTTQLLSVPYALTAGGIRTQAGQGITLTSPNGTAYQLAVNDGGQLSLPTSNQQSNFPTQLFLYGSFNNWNASQALQFGNAGQSFVGYKYFTAGTEIKFLTAQNSNVIYGSNGNNSSGQLVLNGIPLTIQSNGFYKITVDNDNNYSVSSINVQLNQNSTVNTTMQYSTVDNSFTGLSNYGEIKFIVDSSSYGDNLADGIIELNGATIFANQSGNVVYKLYLNFNGSGNYTASSTLPNNLYMVGNFVGWMPSSAIAMTNVSPGIFQINYTFSSAAEIKFNPERNWNSTYGGSAGSLISNGNNIVIPAAGNYNITVNLINNTYTIN